MEFDINGNHMTVDYKGFYNIYNMTAVYGALQAMGEDNGNYQKLLDGFKPQIGRMQEFKLKKPVILNLSKNPAGFNQAIATVAADKRKKDIIFAVNDRVSDGRDISWLWDVDFETSADENTVTLTVSGERMWDVNLRFKYSDITVDVTTDDMEKAISTALETDSEVVYVIANYTAMFPAEAILNKMVKRDKAE